MTASWIVNIFLTLMFVQQFETKGGNTRNKLEENMINSEKNAENVEKHFKNLTSKGHSNQDKIVFNIKPTDDAQIRFSYDKNKPSTGSENKKRDPKYFLNFEFNNKRMDKNALSKKVKMRNSGRRYLPNGMPNPYKYFPLKGEDI